MAQGFSFFPPASYPAPTSRFCSSPSRRRRRVISLASLTAAEVQEFQRRDLPAAETEYRLVASTSPPAIRAIALAGLARVQRLQKEYEGALEAYAELERLGTTLVAGQPAGLVARQGRCKTLEEAGEDERFRAEVRELARALESGDWPIDQATFELYREMLVQWKGTPPSSTAIARTESLIELWHLWRRGDLGSRGRRVLRRDPSVRAGGLDWRCS